jgi:hypothetical protein
MLGFGPMIFFKVQAMDGELKGFGRGLQTGSWKPLPGPLIAIARNLMLKPLKIYGPSR